MTGAGPAGFYVPISQSDVGEFIRIAVHTRGAAMTITPDIRIAVESLDPNLPVYDVMSMHGVIAKEINRDRLRLACSAGEVQKSGRVGVVTIGDGCGAVSGRISITVHGQALLLSAGDPGDAGRYASHAAFRILANLPTEVSAGGIEAP